MIDDASSISGKVRTGQAHQQLGEIHIELPGSKLIYYVLFRELVTNAQRVEATEIDVRLLGENWLESPLDRGAQKLWFEIRDNAKPSEPGKIKRRGAGAHAIPRSHRLLPAGRHAGEATCQGKSTTLRARPGGNRYRKGTGRTLAS